MNLSRKAFTLIELLVVIAIIAILAAILFPVFAQAKAAAKAAASLSNTKELALAALMYSPDYDDTLVPCQSWTSGAPTNPLAIPYAGGNLITWRGLLNPYIKNTDIMTDPAAATIFNNPAYTKSQNQAIFGNYGMNDYYLGGYYWNGGGWSIKAASGTRPADPAGTVYFTEQTSFGSESSKVYTDGPIYYVGMSDAPMCWDNALSGTDPNQIDGYIYCYDNWGMGSFWETDAGIKPQNGGRSGTNAPRVADGVNTAFVDGHSKKLKIGNLAIGTTWSYTTTPGNMHVTPDYKTKYLWDLD